MRISSILPKKGSWEFINISQETHSKNQVSFRFLPLLFLGLLLSVIGLGLLLVAFYLLLFNAPTYFHLLLVIGGLVILGLGQAFKCLVGLRGMLIVLTKKLIGECNA